MFDQSLFYIDNQLLKQVTLQSDNSGSKLPDYKESVFLHYLISEGFAIFKI